MSVVEKHISPLIESQFPAFHKEQGPLFVLFVEEYYKWLESNIPLYSSYDDAVIEGNPLYHSRRLLEYKDIDTTVEEFVVYVKEKYLKNVQFESGISTRRVIKASRDLFNSKGSERSLELFFQMLYGTKIEIYTPGNDILKPSDGTWVLPRYLELTQSSRNVELVGKQITGSSSGATAFAEYLITRNINGKLIDILFLSKLVGDFTTGEVVTNDGILLNAPKIIGSLSSINITVPGELFTVGEIVSVNSANGVEGFARITGIDSVTGVVRFEIIDGGWGYSLDTEVTISDKVISVSNITNSNSSITSFFRNENIGQNLYSFALTDVSDVLSVGSEYNNGNTATPSLSIGAFVTQNTATSYTSNTANLILNQVSANVFSNNIIYEKNRAIVVTNNSISFSLNDTVVQRTGSTNNVLGIVNSVSYVAVLTVNTSSIGANGIHIGTFIEQTTTGATGYISTIPRENRFTFSNVNVIAVNVVNGSFNNTSSITAYSNASKTTTLTTFDPLTSTEGKKYVLINTNLTTNTRWSTSNTMVLVGTPTTNATILLASDIGGVTSSTSDLSATANVFAQNSTHIGITSTTGTFFATGKTVIYGVESNTFANTTTISTGSGASFNIGVISDTETVRLSPDLISSNNDGPGSSSVKFKDMIISGANSTYGNLNSVYIESGGSGYNNTNIVVFTGGNSGGGSFTAGNGSIVTDGSGVITSVGLSSNVGNLIITTPSVSIVNSTGGSTGVGTGATLIPVSSLGFVKLPGADITARLIDVLRFSNKTIGSISSLKSINPGENYNINPFVTVYEPEVASYGKKDFIIDINVTAGAEFSVGELVTQTINTSGVTITSNNFSGNSGLSYEVFEPVYSTDGISNTATGIIYSTTRNVTTNVHTTVLTSNTGTWRNTVNVSVLTVLSNTNFEPGNKILQSTTANGILVTSNSTTLVVSNVLGTFTSGAVTSNASPTPGSTTITAESNTQIYTLIGVTSNGVSSITNTAASSASSSAQGRVKSGNSTVIEVKRISLLTDFTAGGTIVGSPSGTEATVLSSIPDESSRAAGDNGIITANVVSSEGRITAVEVTDSGLGYVDLESVQLLSLDGVRAANGQANVSKQGIGTGYYSSTRGFLDDNKFIFDGEYYQNYSYEVQSPIPLDKYSEVLKSILHISGKRLFGRVVTAPTANVSINTNSSITIS